MFRQRSTKIKIILFAVIMILVVLLGVTERSLRKTIGILAETQATWFAANAINTAVLEKIATNVYYGDLIKTERDYQNQIVFMQINTILLNEIKSGAAMEIQRVLQELKKVPLSIPFGQIFGLRLFANLGPNIKLTIVPAGVISVDIADSFEAAGINQTRHRIYLIAESEVKVVFPLIESTVLVDTQIPIADAIIVGPVPQFYLGSSPLK
ncbi:MAG: sporulation protein YunB [Bacillota bacterium]